MPKMKIWRAVVKEVGAEICRFKRAFETALMSLARTRDEPAPLRIKSQW